MKNSHGFKFYPEERKIVFEGDCLDSVDSCKAMCCRKWDVILTRKEFLSKRYDTFASCRIGQARVPCKNKKMDCANRLYLLNKKKDGSCVYLDRENKCSIYKNRPMVCRDLSCKEGWYISAPCPDEPETKKAPRGEYNDPGRSTDMKFVLNQPIKLKTLFYLKKRKELVFVVKAIDMCSPCTGRIDFDNPRMDDDKLIYLAGLFDGNNNIGDIIKIFKAKYGFKLSKKEMREIIQIFLFQDIILFKNQD